MKKLVMHQKETVDLDYKTIGEAIEYLKSLQDTYGPDAKLENDSYPYEDTTYLFVKVLEEETDKEYQIRVDHEAKMKVWQEERDKKEFERLSAKFKDGES